MTDLTDLCAFLDTAPSPFHAVRAAGGRLDAAGFRRVGETEDWRGTGRGYVVRGGALVGWARPDGAPASAPMRIVGAHTDSPGLRIKPNADAGALGW